MTSCRLLGGERPQHICNPEVLAHGNDDIDRPGDEGDAPGSPKEMLRSGLVEGTAGNLGARLPDGNAVLTPSSLDYGR